MWRIIFKQRRTVRKKPVGEGIRDEFLRRLHWLMFYRVIVITFLLGLTIFVQVKQTPSYLTPSLIYLYIIICAVYFLTLVYVLTINKIKDLVLFTYQQIILDDFLITFLIYSTGGRESVFPFMYILSIITSSILLYRRGGVLTASVCSILYGALLDLEFYGVIHPIYGKAFEQKDYQSVDLFFSILINIIAFYLVAFLSSLLSEQIRRSRDELQEKQFDLDRLETLNRNIVQSISSGLLTMDLNGRVVFFNRAAEEITGYLFSQVHQSKAEEIFPFLRERSRVFKRSSIQDRPPFRFESGFKKQNGETLYLGFSTSPLRNSEGEELGNIVIFQDLTQFKEMEEHIKMVDRLAAVGRLAAGMAHEMRNPLASLSGSIQVLKDGLQLDGRDDRLMDIAIRETERLNSLITDFMLFAQPGLGRKEIVDIDQVISDALDELICRPEWNKEIKVIYDISKNVEIEIDPRQIRQALWNLFVNAIQAMPQGGELRIEVMDVVSEMDGFNPAMDFITIVVSDTGYGIQHDNLDKIFDPFFTTKEKGAGMGLAITYRIIESCRGKIIVSSEVSRGTSFTVYLPVVPSKNQCDFSSNPGIRRP